MKLLVWFKEIRAVGFIDWLWFVMWLKRDEFSRKLDLFMFDDPKECVKQRNRAHHIDCSLYDLNKKVVDNK